MRACKTSESKHGTNNQKLRSGGLVQPRALKTGFPDSPLENVKRANGIKGLKKGGRVGG